MQFYPPCISPDRSVADFSHVPKRIVVFDRREFQQRISGFYLQFFRIFALWIGAQCGAPFLCHAMGRMPLAHGRGPGMSGMASWHRFCTALRHRLPHGFPSPSAARPRIPEAAACGSGVPLRAAVLASCHRATRGSVRSGLGKGSCGLRRPGFAWAR